MCVEQYAVPPDVRLHIYDDDWTIDTKKYRWREAGPDAATGVAAFESVSKLSLRGANLITGAPHL